MSETLKQYNAARRVSVPLVVWKTPDAAATISSVKNSEKADYPIFSWDIVRGVMPVNDQAMGKGGQGIGIGNPPDMLDAAQKLPKHSVLFMHNAQRFVDDSTVLQGIWNLRDTNKSEHRMLVLLAPQMRTPIELSNDILAIDEQLPDAAQLRDIVEAQISHAQVGAKESGVKFDGVTSEGIDRAVDALSGLSAFSAEQTVAVSFEKNGKGVVLNPVTLWDRKRQAIEETQGLTVWRDGETLDDVQGCSNIKNFVGKVIGGMQPRGVVFIDEIEKALGGASGDSSGTTQDQLAVLLKEMQDKKAEGILFVGHPGSAKSMVAKATGNTAGVVTISLDLGAMKGRHVGDSEQAIRAAMKVIDSVSQGRALYIATCNKIMGDSMPPELKRRFTLGTFFFDLPTQEERAAIWKFYLKKFGLKGNPNDIDGAGWTGADIFNCCKRAAMFKCSIVESAKYATPICKTDPMAIEALRNVADNAFISANYEGLYRKNKQTVVVPKREMRFD